MSSPIPHTFAEPPWSPSSGLVLVLQKRSRPSAKTEHRETHSQITVIALRDKEMMGKGEAGYMKENNMDLTEISGLGRGWGVQVQENLCGREAGG